MEKNSGQWAPLLQAAVAAVRDCAEVMESRAVSIQQALPTVPMDDGLRATVMANIAGLRDTSARVTFELALLQAELDGAPPDIQAVVKRLSVLDATLMGSVAGMTDVLDELENAAERDESNERAFVLVIEATGVLLQGIEKSKAATLALRAAAPTASR